MHTSAWCGIFVCAAVSAASGQNLPMHILAYEGQTAPDGRTFVSTTAPEVSPAGEVVFWSSAHSGDQGWGYSLYRWKAGSALEKVVASGDPAQGVPGSVFEDLWSYPRVIAPGRTWFTARISTDPYNSDLDDTVWAMHDGRMSLIAREGDHPLTPIPAAYGQYFGPLSPGPSGEQLVFGNVLRGDNINTLNDGALFYHEDGRSRLLVWEGSDFSARSPGVHVADISRSVMPSMTMDSNGVVAFDIGLDGRNVEPEDNRAILMGRPGELDIAVRRGQPAPGAGAGMNFGPFKYTSINAGGRLAFIAELNRDGMTSRDGEGIWLGTPDDLALQIRDGDRIPGVDGGAEIYSFDRVVQNHRGDWCAFAETDRFDEDERAVLYAESGELPITIAYSGMQAPGFDDGVSFSDDSFSFVNTLLSPDGYVAFTGSLEGPGIDNSNHFGLWAFTPDGGLRSVLQIGDELEVSPDDVRTVEWVRLREGGTTRNAFDQGFGVGGLLTASIEFTDSTNAVVAFVIPAPAGGMLLLSGLAIALRRRRATSVS